MENTIYIKGVICAEEHKFYYELFEGETTTTSIVDVETQLANIQSRNVALYIDSRGGDIEEGYKIYNLLKSSGKKITTNIIFACYSTATFIAMVGSKVIINPYARFGIHNPYFPEGTIGGDADALERQAKQLRKYENEFAHKYAEKTGKPFDEIKALMKEDIALTSQEALEWGFVDEIAGVAATEEAQAMMRKRTGAIAFMKPSINQSNENMSEVKLSQEDKSLLTSLGDSIKALANKVLGSPKAEDEEAAPAPAAATPEEMMAEIEALKAENEALKTENETLKAKIAELEGTTEQAETVKTELHALKTQFNALNEKLHGTYGEELKAAPAAQEINKGKAKPVTGSKADKLAEAMKRANQ